MSDNSVIKDLYEVSHYLHSQWNLKSTAHTSKHMTVIHAEDSVTMKQSHSSQAIMRDSRTVKLYKNLLLYWVSYVHFRI